MLLACAATFLALLLAFGKGGPFNRQLAIQTGTLLGVVWYVYFTFRMARPRAWVALSINPDLRIKPDRNRPALCPKVENKINRRLLARIILRAWVDKKPARLGPFYRGEHYFPIEARLSPAGVVPLEDYVAWSDEGFEQKELLIFLEAEWIDSLCERGRTKKYWRTDLRTGQTAAVIDPVRQEELFGPLPDPYQQDGKEQD